MIVKLTYVLRKWISPEFHLIITIYLSFSKHALKRETKLDGTEEKPKGGEDMLKMMADKARREAKENPELQKELVALAQEAIEFGLI